MELSGRAGDLKGLDGNKDPFYLVPNALCIVTEYLESIVLRTPISRGALA